MSDGNTTEFIRRRIRHWRTTLAGIACIVGPIIAVIYPEYAVKILTITLGLSGAGHLAGADGKNVQQ